jgi:transposase
MSATDPIPENLDDAIAMLLEERRRVAERDRQLHETVTQLDSATAVLEATSVSHAELLEKYNATVEELRVIRRWAFGRRRERISDADGQRHLFDLEPAEPAEAPTTSDDDAEQDAGAERREGRRQRRAARQLNLDALPNIEHQHDLSAEEKLCECCGRDKQCIGEDISRQLEFQPASLELHIHKRPKYACQCGQCGVATPAAPDRPLNRSIAGPGLLAGLIVGKFGDHLPLYRLEDIFVRHGVHLPRSTLCDWMANCAELLRPLHDLQKELVLKSPVLWTDDTPVTFLGDKSNPGSHTGRYWAYVGDGDHPYSVYDFTVSRKRDGPMSFLTGYSGFVHADAYSGYDAVYFESDGRIIECACMAHARRKFFEATQSNPRYAHEILEWIRQLYDIEDRAGELTADERLKLRQSESIRILNLMEHRIQTLDALPKSSLGRALTYARNQWSALRRFTTDGRITIDNNTAERTLRAQAVGRKNWLFLGSEQAGDRSAVLNTILAGAKRHHLEPWAYLRDILLHLHGETDNLERLLPDRWATANPAHILTYRLEESRRKATRQKERRAHRRCKAKAK